MNAFLGVKNIDDFSNVLGIRKKILTYVIYGVGIDNSYINFEIPKKNGGVRKISAPNKRLKIIQKKLADKLWESQEEFFERNKVAHAFIKNKGIVSNARIHRNKKIVLNIDIEDFFPSFNFGRVYGFFKKDRDFMLPDSVAKMVAQLTCYNGYLPQGAPTSPIVTNLICRIMDIRILKLARKYKLDYTRYADDLTFSTNDKSFDEKKVIFMKKLNNEIRRAGFNINKNKTRVQYENMRQIVTGIVVNKKLNVPADYCKKTRAMADNLYRHGVFYIDGKEGNINMLEGRFSFINQLDKYNNSFEFKYKSIKSNNIEHQKYLLSLESNKAKRYTMLHKSNKREREYQKFLFYKYFYGNSKPTIVTEGKTDILYLKAALKNLYLEYPELIEKDGDDFKFKISFLRRKKVENPTKMTKFKYFFNLESDGADAIANIYYFFIDDRKNGVNQNYLKYFKEICPRKIPLNPTVLIFDNETEKTKPLKPLRKFIQNNISKPEEKFEKVRANEYVDLVEDSLYLIATPLFGEKESDMELLLVDDFKKLGQSKDSFSKQVFREYAKWDFSKFRPLLDNLRDVIVQHQKKVEEEN